MRCSLFVSALYSSLFSATIPSETYAAPQSQAPNVRLTAEMERYHRCTGRTSPPVTDWRQHVGNARTYLIAWLSIRSRGGRVVLRIEDIDSPRIKAARPSRLATIWRGSASTGTKGLLSKLNASSLSAHLDQFKRRKSIRASAHEVISSGPPAHPTRKITKTVYPGTCSGRRVADAATLGDRPLPGVFEPMTEPSISTTYSGADFEIDPEVAGGDFVVWKSAGTPAYQLAVVVDDAANGVTEVIRGDDSFLLRHVSCSFTTRSV